MTDKGMTMEEIEKLFSGDEWIEESSEQYPMHNFVKQPALQGVLVEKRTGIGKNNSNLYVIEQANTNKKFTVWGSTVIDVRMGNKEPGTEVGIIYLGEKKSEKSNRTYKDYKFYFKKPSQ